MTDITFSWRDKKEITYLCDCILRHVPRLTEYVELHFSDKPPVRGIVVGVASIIQGNAMRVHIILEKEK